MPRLFGPLSPCISLETLETKTAELWPCHRAPSTGGVLASWGPCPLASGSFRLPFEFWPQEPALEASGAPDVLSPDTPELLAAAASFPEPALHAHGMVTVRQAC